MKAVLLISIISIVLSSICDSQTEFYKSGTHQFEVSMNYYTAPNLFDVNGKQIIQLDTLYQEFPRKYIFIYKKYETELLYKYFLFDNLKLSLKVPLSIKQFSRSLTIDTNKNSPTYGYKSELDEDSFFSIDYYQLGSEFLIDTGMINPIILCEYRIPYDFKAGIKSPEGNIIKYYIPYEFLIGGILKFNFEKSWIELLAKYNWRSCSFKDQLVIRIESGFSTVPFTSLRAFFTYVRSLSDYVSAVPITPSVTPFQEDYGDIGFAFKFLAGNNFYADFSYKIRLGFKNTINEGMFNLSIGYITR